MARRPEAVALMCMGDAHEGNAIHDATFPRARRPYRCGECQREIPAGEQYERVRALSYDGWWFGAVTCLHCVVAREWLSVICSSWLYEGVQEDLGEHRWEEPYCTVGLLRLIAGMKRRWAWRDGLVPLERVREWLAQSLAPIPTAHRGAA